MGSRSTLLRLHERLLSRDTFRILAQLERQSPPLPALRLAALQQLVRHASREIPYWRQRLEGLDERSLSLDDLSPLPILTRSEIVCHREAMRWRGPGKELIHRSGGTTDDNLEFYWGRERQAWDRATRYRGLQRLGIQPGDRTLHLWPREKPWGLGQRTKAWLRSVRDRMLADAVIDPRPWTPGGIDRLVRAIRRYRPRLIIAYPSWLMRIACRLESTCGPLELAEVVLTCGEMLFDFQRAYLQRMLGAAVFQEYGSQDAGLIAHEDASRSLRFNAEAMVVEVLRGGRTAAPGELGEVVVTHFQTPRMPFLRYATGDVVRATEPSDVRASGTSGFPLPEGRTSDLLVRGDGELVAPRPVVESLAAASGVLLFCLDQRRADRIEVQCSREFGAIDPRTARATLGGFLGESVQVDVAVGDRFRDLRSGKHRYACCPLAVPRIAHDRTSGPELARCWPQLVESA